MIGWLIAILIALIIYIRQENHEIMAQIDDLNAAITGVSNAVTSLQQDVATVITYLQTLQPAANVDLSGPIAALGAIAANLSSIDATVKAAEPTAPAPTPAQ